MPLTRPISVLLCLVLHALNFATIVAFTNYASTTRTAGRSLDKGCCLGPVARNGMAYDDIKIGEGRRILPGDTVYCYYQGFFTKPAEGFFGKPSKTVFDEITKGQPLAIVIGKGQVIPGWDLGILGGLDGEIPPMNVGGRRSLYIPAGLAYGAKGAGPIPPNQDLEFELEVLQAGKESDISLQYRLGGYAVALGVPIVILAIVYTLFNS